MPNRYSQADATSGFGHAAESTAPEAEADYSLPQRVQRGQASRRRPTISGHPRPSFGLGDVSWVAFLVLVFVGLQPFAGREEQSLATLATGDGDLARQV